MIKSKYSEAFQALSKKGVFSAKEGRRAGIPSRMLNYFCSKGSIERVGRGLYRVQSIDFGSDFEWEELGLAALSVPHGVICLISALCYYGLTDEIMREFWIAIPHSTTAPIREHMRIVRMRNLSLGQTTIQLGGHKLKIFDRERTVVDAFRYLDKETALKALKGYLEGGGMQKPNITKLLAYSRNLRVNLSSYLAALMV